MSRATNKLREIKITAFATNAPGSVLIDCGETRVLCTAHIARDTPSWLKDQDAPRGWVNAEYNMLPGSTLDRKKRGTDGRSTEIQRLIARVLRGAVDLQAMPGLFIQCDCEIIKADGGTRTTAINGAFVALAQALQVARNRGLIAKDPIKVAVGAISVGIVDGKAVLDLDYALDRRAEVDLNVAMTTADTFLEIQGTGEAGDFNRDQLNEMLDLAQAGIREIHQVQQTFLDGLN